MRIFKTQTIRPLFNNTLKRIQAINRIPKKWHKEHAGIFKIEDKNVLKEWEPFCKELQTKLRTVVPDVAIDDELAFKFAFYLHFVAQFYNHFGDETDRQYIGDVDAFFAHYQAELGERNEATLFLNAFKHPSCH